MTKTDEQLKARLMTLAKAGAPRPTGQLGEGLNRLTTPTLTLAAERSLAARINRRLRPDGEVLRKTRGERASVDLGDYYIMNFYHNIIVSHHVDIEVLGRELGVL